MSHDPPSALRSVCDQLRVDPTVEVRADTAKHVGTLLSSAALTPAERQTALDILGKLVHDVEQEVRHSLAVHVANCAILPPVLTRAIAEDIEAIAVPFIRVSPALSDADLLTIISFGGEAKQVAIAGRQSVSEGVTEALVGTRRPAVVTTLLQNDGAQISERAYHEIVDDFAGHAAVQDLLVDRAALPLTIVERLVRLVSDELQHRLVEKHALPPDFAVELLGQARERTLMHGAVSIPRTFDVERFAWHLKHKGELTPTLLMRALCEGDIHFFEVGLAVRAGIPWQNSVALITDGGPLGFKALYEKADLPPQFFRAFRAALDVFARLRIDGQQDWSPANAQLILNQVMREYDEACPADVEYLLSQMSHQILGREDQQWRR